MVGNFLGTLVVYVVLLGYRRHQLGWQFDRGLLRAMNRFGLPLVPAALALWAINFIDRLFINQFKGQAEVGIYSLAVRISLVIIFLMTAFQLAWPAFAYSIADDGAAKRTYSYVLTYLLFITCWMSLSSACSRRGSSPPSTRTTSSGARRRPCRCCASPRRFGYTVLAIGIGRARQTQFNWIVTGAAAVVNIVLNVVLIPPYGMMGAAVATIVAYVALFAGMWLNSRRVFPVRTSGAACSPSRAAAGALTVLGYQLHSFPVAIACLAYPLLLALLGFYEPAERLRLRRLVPGSG